MLRSFNSRQLLAVRSSLQFGFQGVDIALRLAVLGFIQQAVEIIDLTSQCCNLDVYLLPSNGLYFAFEAASIWPSIVFEEHRTSEYLRNLDEDQVMYKWGTIHGVFGDSVHEALTMDEAGLQRLLDFVNGDCRERFTYPVPENQYMQMEQIGARCMAVDLALRLGGHEEEAHRLVHYQNLDDKSNLPFWKEIAKSRRAWTILKEGSLANPTEQSETLFEFERLKGVFRQRLESGAQRPFKDQTVRELVEIINRNTLSHDNDDDCDDSEILELREAGLLENRSLLHEPATDSEIAQIEMKFNFKLPEDYKEFLKVTNGMEGMWNGFYRNRALGNLAEVTLKNIFSGHDDLPCALMDELGELPFNVDWPRLDLTRALSLNRGGDDGETWLVDPTLIKEAVESFFVGLDEAEPDEKEKATVERTVSDYFGSMQELKDMEWALMTWSHWGVSLETWKSFRELLESLAMASELNTAL